jgi:hypothetical protein
MDFFNKAAQSFGGGNAAEGELFQKAEGFLGSQGGSAPAASGGQAPGAAPGGAPPAQQSASGGGGNSQLYGSAQTLYQGLEDKISGRQSNIDDQQLAEAASNVLKAADGTSYVKDSQYGQYVDEAQSYLQNYGGSQGTPASAPAAAGARDPRSAGPPAASTDAPYDDGSSYQ